MFTRLIPNNSIIRSSSTRIKRTASPPNLLQPHITTDHQVLEVFEGGQSGGVALKEVLTGDTNPSARLPFTIYPEVRGLVCLFVPLSVCLFGWLLGCFYVRRSVSVPVLPVN
jgi:hypothetical protein